MSKIPDHDPEIHDYDNEVPDYVDEVSSEPALESEEHFEYVSREEAELKQVAMDIYHQNIFTDTMIGHSSMTGMVFMPLIFTKTHILREMQPVVGMLYEHYSESLPSSINGMPIFMSMHILDKIDTDKVWTYYDEYKAKMEKLKSEWPDIQKSDTNTEF